MYEQITKKLYALFHLFTVLSPVGTYVSVVLASAQIKIPAFFYATAQSPGSLEKSRRG